MVIDPKMVHKPYSACDEKLTRLTLLTAIMIQVLAGMCFKLIRNPRALSTEVMLTVGPKTLVLTIAPEVKPIKITPRVLTDPRIDAWWSEPIARFADRCP